MGLAAIENLRCGIFFGVLGPLLKLKFLTVFTGVPNKTTGPTLSHATALTFFSMTLYTYLYAPLIWGNWYIACVN